MTVAPVWITGLSSTPDQPDHVPRMDPELPHNRLMRRFRTHAIERCAFAEYEKAIIMLRLAAGRAAKRAGGGKGSGSR
jgi:hypothetical protein